MRWYPLHLLERSVCRTAPIMLANSPLPGNSPPHLPHSNAPIAATKRSLRITPKRPKHSTKLPKTQSTQILKRRNFKNQTSKEKQKRNTTSTIGFQTKITFGDERRTRSKKAEKREELTRGTEKRFTCDGEAMRCDSRHMAGRRN